MIVAQLDGIALGEPVAAIVSQRGAPAYQNGQDYEWTRSDGTVARIRTEDGRVVLVDVYASRIRRGDDVLLSLQKNVALQFGYSHVNVDPAITAPLVQFGEAKLPHGQAPALMQAYRTAPGSRLIMFFEGGPGNADGDLREVVLGTRAALAQQGIVSK